MKRTVRFWGCMGALIALAGCQGKVKTKDLTLVLDSPRDVSHFKMEGPTKISFEPGAFDVATTYKVVPGEYKLSWKTPRNTYEFKVQIADYDNPRLKVILDPPYLLGTRAEVVSGGMVQ